MMWGVGVANKDKKDTRSGIKTTSLGDRSGGCNKLYPRLTKTTAGCMQVCDLPRKNGLFNYLGYSALLRF